MASDDLDRLLDAALTGYSSEEPRPGLERRVLARVRAAGTPRRFEWRWVFALPVLAAALLLAIVYRMPAPPVPPERRILVVQAPAVEMHVAARNRSRPVISRRVAARYPSPKRAVFPLPTPLSAGERALVNLATRFPDQARGALAVKRGIEPIEIPEIQIPLLPGGSDQ